MPCVAVSPCPGVGAVDADSRGQAVRPGGPASRPAPGLLPRQTASGWRPCPKHLLTFPCSAGPVGSKRGLVSHLARRGLSPIWQRHPRVRGRRPGARDLYERKQFWRRLAAPGGVGAGAQQANIASQRLRAARSTAGPLRRPIAHLPWSLAKEPPPWRRKIKLGPSRVPPLKDQFPVTLLLFCLASSREDLSFVSQSPSRSPRMKPVRHPEHSTPHAWL